MYLVLRYINKHCAVSQGMYPIAIESKLPYQVEELCDHHNSARFQVPEYSKPPLRYAKYSILFVKYPSLPLTTIVRLLFSNVQENPMHC